MSKELLPSIHAPEYGITKQRRDFLLSMTEGHVELIGITAEKFRKEVSALLVDYFGEPVVIYPKEVKGQLKFEEVA